MATSTRAAGSPPPPQYFPLIFSPLAAVLLGVLGGWETSPRKLALGTGLVGGASVVMGLVGVGLHLVPVVGDLAKEEVLSFAVVMETLGSAPPLLAPGAYFAIGALVVALGSRRLRISVEEGSSQNPGLPTSAAERAVLEQAA